VGENDRAGFGEGGADGSGDPRAREALANAVKNGGVGGGRAIVVAQQNRQGIGTGADDRDGFDRRFQRQDVALVFQQDDGFARSFERQ
jgi:hypothetical protein